MATSKLLRAAPPKNLRDYVASSRKLFAEPDSIPDSLFKNFIAPGVDPNAESTIYTSGIPLGFQVKINDVLYSKVTVAVPGWMALEGDSPFALSDILESGALVYENHRIRSTFRRHILLAPWFDRLWPVPNSVPALLSTNWYDNATQLDGQTVQDIYEGINTESWPFSFTDRGVRYHRGYDKNFGKYFVCRWTTAKLENKLNCGRIKFECIIFENGRIEYRYWPRLDYVTSAVPPVITVDIDASVGIFWNFPTSYQFRDFATLIDYSVGQRNLSDLGGAPYDSGYIEGIQPYSINIVKTQNWPNTGAVIVFSPPTNPYNVLPQKTVKQVNASKNIVKEPGIFDDRRSVIFSGSTNIFYPTTLPSRLIGETGDVDVSLRQILYTSGSIKTTGSTDKAAVDTFLTQLEGVSHDFYKKDNSFNEFYKDYRVNDSSLSFFATGSKLETFGEGFTSPLKSKTQFHLSLPIHESTILPATRACVLYYNQERKKWDNIDDSGWREPEPISLNTAAPNVFPYEKDNEFYYRVTETARAFDAVGRKITLSSKRNNISIGSSIVPSYQRDDIIGLIVNTDDSLSQSKLRETLTKEYPASFTDSSDYLPSSSQGIVLPIDYPFLIEKIVVEFPFAAAGNWFEDKTTCIRPQYPQQPGGASTIFDGEIFGPIDFGGPGITFSIFCAKKSLDFYRADLIASGTITHEFDNKSDVILRQEFFATIGTNQNWSLRPEGFKHFSTPTTVLSGTAIGSSYFFSSKVRLEMEAAISSGITFSRNERRPNNSSDPYVNVNRQHAIDLLTKQTAILTGEDVDSSTYTTMNSIYNIKDIYPANVNDYNHSSPRIYVHEVHPISRGSTGVYFNGSSILGGTVSSISTKTDFENQLFVTRISSSLPSSYKNQIDQRFFRFDAVSLYSTFSSKTSPYLIMPGEKLTFCLSKTRSAVNEIEPPAINSGDNAHFSSLLTSGSHDTIAIAPGSLEVTVYGSYVREGMEYHQ